MPDSSNKSESQHLYELAQTVSAQTATIQALVKSMDTRTEILFGEVKEIKKTLQIVPLLKLSSIITFGLCSIILVGVITVWVQGTLGAAAANPAPVILNPISP